MAITEIYGIEILFVMSLPEYRLGLYVKPVDLS